MHVIGNILLFVACKTLILSIEILVILDEILRLIYKLNIIFNRILIILNSNFLKITYFADIAS